MTPQEEFAQETVVICSELNCRVEAGRGCGYNLIQLAETVFGDALYGKFKSLILSVCGTLVLRNFLFDEDLFLYGFLESRRPFGNWPRDHGIDLEQKKWGIFDKDGAREYEKNQLLIQEPRRIMRAFLYLHIRRASSILVCQWQAQELSWRVERFLRWQQEFERYYEIPAPRRNTAALG